MELEEACGLSIIEGSLNRNFRQYGQLKSRCIAQQAVESPSQSTKDAIARKSEERRYIRAKC